MSVEKLNTFLVPDNTADLLPDELCRYVTGEMGAEERAEVEAYLAVSPSAQMDVADLRRQLELEKTPFAPPSKSEPKRRWLWWGAGGTVATATCLVIVMYVSNVAPSGKRIASLTRQLQGLRQEKETVETLLSQKLATLRSEQEKIQSQNQTLTAAEKARAEASRAMVAKLEAEVKILKDGIELRDRKARDAESRLAMARSKPSGGSMGLTDLARVSAQMAALVLPQDTRGGPTEVRRDIVPVSGWNTRVSSTTPLLAWEGPAGAQEWLIEIRESKTGAPVWPLPGDPAVPIQAKSFVPKAGTLRRGGVYYWTVQEPGQAIASTKFGFAVMSSAESSGVAKALSRATSTAQKFEILLQNGLFDEAAFKLSEATDISAEQRRVLLLLIKTVRQSNRP